MSAASKYFSALFRNEMKEKYAADILLGDIDGDTLLNIIEFCYMGVININKRNVDAVAAAAHMFCLTQLEKRCTKYYERYLAASNCLGIWMLAKLYNFGGIIDKAREIALDKFMKVINGNEFKYIECELLVELLSNNAVNVRSEEDIFNAIAIWMEVDLTKRRPCIQELMKIVRVELLNDSVCTLTKIDLKAKIIYVCLFILTFLVFPRRDIELVQEDTKFSVI